MSHSQHTLRITEIFHSLQGESSYVGIPTVFIRLTGCPLRCQYCDTSYAFHGGKKQSLEQILETIASFNCRYICVTGGEPLAQPACIDLLRALCDLNYKVSLETSGSLSIEHVDARVMIVMDIKTPGSQELTKNRWENIPLLKPSDEIKFVLCHRDDYEWACSIINEYHLEGKVQLLFSPSATELAPSTLAEWMLEDKLSVRFQLQLHKILWNNAQGR